MFPTMFLQAKLLKGHATAVVLPRSTRLPKACRQTFQLAQRRTERPWPRVRLKCISHRTGLDSQLQERQWEEDLRVCNGYDRVSFRTGPLFPPNESSLVTTAIARSAQPPKPRDLSIALPRLINNSSNSSSSSSVVIQLTSPHPKCGLHPILNDQEDELLLPNDLLRCRGGPLRLRLDVIQTS
jgi:hypothetical protein